jgi:hypothetical protein
MCVSITLAIVLENKLHTSEPRVHSPSNVYRSSQERKKEKEGESHKLTLLQSFSSSY